MFSKVLFLIRQLKMHDKNKEPKTYQRTKSLLLDGELLRGSEHSGADHLATNVPILGLPPGSVNLKVLGLGLDVFINCSEPGCSWTPSRSPRVNWGSVWINITALKNAETRRIQKNAATHLNPTLCAKITINVPSK